MENRSDERVAVFVDGANLYHSIKSYYGGVLDYGRLLEAAVAGRRLLRGLRWHAWMNKSKPC